MSKPIIKGEVRILRPHEYELLWKGAEDQDNQTRLDSLLLSGLRYVEGQRLQAHPDWLDDGFLHLPDFAQKKKLRTQRERWVRLSSKGRTIIRYFFKTKPLPSWSGWTHNLERWAESSKLDPIGLGPKTTRKTWESWLVSSYPERFPEIVVSQGHTTFVAVNHYLGLPFDRRDKEEMSEWVSGWEK